MKEFNKIIGYNAIKDELIQISDSLKNTENYRKLGVKTPRGLMLYGDPGVGKTLMADALAKASGRKTFVCRKDMPDGDFINEIISVFEKAGEAEPSIVFLDDMDKFASGDPDYRNHEEYVTIQSCIDNSKDKDIFVLATANDIDLLPVSLLRPGRFDRLIEVCNPDGDDAANIMDHYIKQKKCVGEIDASVVARIMSGRSCAELETVINEAGIIAGYERSDVITMDHLTKACLHTVHNIPNEVLNAGPLDIDIYDANSGQVRAIWHEAGHAVVAEALNPGRVNLVSVFSRRGGAGGYTSCNGSGCYDMIEKELTDICIALAGKAALDQKFGVADVGVEQDLEIAANTVKSLLGDCCTNGFDLYTEKYRYSDNAKARLEQAAARELDRLYRKTKEILIQNDELLCGIAKALTKKRYLMASDIEKIRSGCRFVPAKL